jgi:hypothetical protein
MIFRVALVVAAAPILVAAVHNGLVGWFPSADTAITAIRAHDVFSAHPPLTGLPASTSMQSAVAYDYLGAPLEQLLAVPVRLLGVSWGMLIGIGVLNTAWFATAMWLIRRRVGYRLGVVACLFGAMLCWSVGSQAMVDPTPVSAGMFAVLVLYAGVWSAAEGDDAGVVALAVAGNFLVLVHLKFIVVVPLMVAVGLAAWIHRVRRLTSGAHPGGGVDRPRPLRTVAIAACVTAIFWLAPLWQQVRGSPGNIGQVVRGLPRPQAPHPDVHHGIIDAIGVVASPIVSWRLWSRWSFVSPDFDVFGPNGPFVTGAVGVVIVIALVVGLGWAAHARGDSVMRTGAASAALAWIAWTATAVADRSSPWYHRYYQALWPLAMFVWLVIVLGVLRSDRFRRLVSGRRITWFAPGALTAVAVVFGALSIPIMNAGSSTTQEAIPIAKRLYHETRTKVPPGPPVLVTIDPAAWTHAGEALLGLRARGTEFRVATQWEIRTYGSARAHRPGADGATRELIITRDADPPRGSTVLGSSVDLSRPLAEHLAVGRRFDAWAAAAASRSDDGRDGPAAKILAVGRKSGRSPFVDPWLVDALASGEFPDLVDAITIPGSTRSAKLRWLQDQRLVLSDAAVHLYLRPIGS